MRPHLQFRSGSRRQVVEYQGPLEHYGTVCAPAGCGEREGAALHLRNLGHALSRKPGVQYELSKKVEREARQTRNTDLKQLIKKSGKDLLAQVKTKASLPLPIVDPSENVKKKSILSPQHANVNVKNLISSDTLNKFHMYLLEKNNEKPKFARILESQESLTLENQSS